MRDDPTYRQGQDQRGVRLGRSRLHDGAVFILYAVVIGVALGLVLGGRPMRLARLRFHWAPVIALGLLVQVALFSTPLGEASGDAAPWIYVASNGLVLAAVLRNVAIPGMALVALGGASNVVAIVANGGYMPVSPAALAAMGRAEQAGYSNSKLVEGVVLAPLTDVFAMPMWVPFANVFSVGDLLIGTGIVIAIVTGMRGANDADATEAADTPSASAAEPRGALTH